MIRKELLMLKQLDLEKNEPPYDRKPTPEIGG